MRLTIVALCLLAVTVPIASQALNQEDQTEASTNGSQSSTEQTTTENKANATETPTSTASSNTNATDTSPTSTESSPTNATDASPTSTESSTKNATDTPPTSTDESSTKNATEASPTSTESSVNSKSSTNTSTETPAVNQTDTSTQEISTISQDLTESPQSTTADSNNTTEAVQTTTQSLETTSVSTSEPKVDTTTVDTTTSASTNTQACQVFRYLEISQCPEGTLAYMRSINGARFSMPNSSPTARADSGFLAQIFAFNNTNKGVKSKGIACLGVFLSSNRVLVPAHCLYNSTNNEMFDTARVTNGGLLRYRTRFQSLVNLTTSAQVHPKFEMAHPEKLHDLAVIALTNSEYAYSDVVYAKISSELPQYISNYYALSYGRNWNTLRQTAPLHVHYTKINQYVDFPTELRCLNNTEWAVRLLFVEPSLNYNKMLGCYADAGMPLLRRQFLGVPSVAGLLSFVVNGNATLCTADEKIAFTSLAVYKPWIDSQM